jgi:prepilin-type N-terminal cleavage/methylation domain-containing protein
MRRNRHNLKGFTLIEVLATMVLMAIILPVTMQALSVSLGAASSARHTTEAAGLAQEKLNELISTGQLNAISNGDFGTDHPGYRWEIGTTTRDYNLTEVSLRVLWTERGQEKSLAVSTLVQPDQNSGTTSTGITTP